MSYFHLQHGHTGTGSGQDSGSDADQEAHSQNAHLIGDGEKALIVLQRAAEHIDDVRLSNSTHSQVQSRGCGRGKRGSQKTRTEVMTALANVVPPGVFCAENSLLAVTRAGTGGPRSLEPASLNATISYRTQQKQAAADSITKTTSALRYQSTRRRSWQRSGKRTKAIARAHVRTHQDCT